MPTGYTADVQSGKVTEFSQFAMQCARAFGALVTMRDDPPDAAIPQEFQPTSYHVEKLSEARDTLSRLRAMTVDQRDLAARKHYEDARASWDKYEAERAAARSRYDAMLAHVRTWQPPSPEHDGLKSFMIDQLEKSIDFDCSPPCRNPPKPMRRDDWFNMAVAQAERDIAYHTEENANEVDRASKRTEWVRALRKSLEAKS